MDSKVREKVIAMIGLLGSENDGELVAAARAIQRLLAANGQTFGDLKAALAPAREGRVIVVEREPTRHRQMDTADELLVVVEYMHSHERGFIEQMHRRLSESVTFQMSERQENWFYLLHARYVR